MSVTFCAPFCGSCTPFTASSYALKRDLEALDRRVGLDRVGRARLGSAAARAVSTRRREFARDDDLALVGARTAACRAGRGQERADKHQRGALEPSLSQMCPPSYDSCV